VVREKSATFRQTADLEQIRPGPQTVFPGLFLAGDHTKTGWPSTMEGAVRSGLITAKELLKSMGKTTLLEHEIIETKRSWAQWWLSPKLPN
jgi:zeta-carotene desaturase